MTLHITMEGTSPLLMHNSRLIDPLDPVVRAIAEITGKRKKTVEDHQEIRRLEWRGSLYLGADGLPAMPATNPRRCFAAAATRHRLGKAVERGVLLMEGEIPLQYEGPRTVDALWEDERFRSVLPVKVSSSGSTMRCRPSFFPWRLDFDVELLTDVLDEASFTNIVEESGIYEGLGDGRRIGFGRFRGKIG